MRIGKIRGTYIKHPPIYGYGIYGIFLENIKKNKHHTQG